MKIQMLKLFCLAITLGISLSANGPEAKALPEASLNVDTVEAAASARHLRVETLIRSRNGFPLTAIAITKSEAAETENQAAIDHVVILPGLTEAAILYLETAIDLIDLGARRVLIVDHRSQGNSGRYLEDSFRVHALHFSEYVDDIEFWLNEAAALAPRVALIGHSMGGGILARYLQTKPHPRVAAAVLSAPMLEIHQSALFGFSPENALRLFRGICLVPAACRQFAGTFGVRPPGWRLPFEAQKITASRQRYETAQGFFDRYPHLETAGPTNSWVAAAIELGLAIGAEKTPIEIPIQIFTAETENFVSTRAIATFCGKQRACRNDQLLGTWHSLFSESDSARDTMLRGIARFLQLSGGRSLHGVH